MVLQIGHKNIHTFLKDLSLAPFNLRENDAALQKP
jgi:hypothetical protein